MIWARCLGLLVCTSLSLLLGSCALSQSTKPIVKVGLVAPFEGRYRSLGYEVLYAVKWAVRQRNEEGGVAGSLIELVALDDGGDAEASAFQARKFAVDPDVMGVVGPFSYPAVLAAGPLYHRFGLAMVTPATCSPLLVSMDYEEIFCLGASVVTLEQTLTERLPPGAQVTLLRTMEGPMGDRMTARAGQVLVAPWDDTTLTELRHRPAGIYLYDGDVLSAAELLRRMRQAGIDAPFWGGPSLARAQLPQIAGDAAIGACYAITAPLLVDLRAESPFVTGYRELAGSMPGPWAALAYDATHLLLDALEREIEGQGWPTREGVIARLAKVRGPDGMPVFVRGQRRQAEMGFYCYASGDSYPGRVSEP